MVYTVRAYIVMPRAYIIGSDTAMAYAVMAYGTPKCSEDPGAARTL